MTLLQIKKFLDDNDATFLGIRIGYDVLGRYLERFPEDTAATNLENWHAFELDNPDTFLGMYQLLIQRPRGRG